MWLCAGVHLNLALAARPVTRAYVRRSPGVANAGGSGFAGSYMPVAGLAIQEVDVLVRVAQVATA